MSCGLDHAVRAVVEHDHAAVRQPAGRGGGAAQQRRLRARLRDERARRERRDLHHARIRGPSRRGVEQVVRRAPVGVEPAAPPDAARRHARARDLKGVQRAPIEWALDLERALLARRATDREVTCAVDHEARVSGEHLREHIGEQPLRQAAAVELHAGRAGHGARAHVDRDALPRARTGRRGRLARRRELERH
jgi:hypothetical protein